MHRVLLVCLLAAAPAAAFQPQPAPDPALDRLRAQIEAGGAAAALPELERLRVARQDHVDVLSLLGFAYRHLGDAETSRVWYDRALARDPRHAGALEYLGELELTLDRVPAARALFARLAAVCPMGCEALDDLRAAFADTGVSPTSP